MCSLMCLSAVQLHAVLDAARAHHAELTFIAEHMPQYLPGQTARPSGYLLSQKASHSLTRLSPSIKEHLRSSPLTHCAF